MKLHRLLQSLMDTHIHPKLVMLMNEETISYLNDTVERFYEDTTQDVQYILDLSTLRTKHNSQLSTIDTLCARVFCIDANRGYTLWACKTFHQPISPPISVRTLNTGRRQHFLDPNTETPE